MQHQNLTGRNTWACPPCGACDCEDPDCRELDRAMAKFWAAEFTRSFEVPLDTDALQGS